MQIKVSMHYIQFFQEEIAALNLAKFNKAQQELDDVNERVDQAETLLVRNRPQRLGSVGPNRGQRGQSGF